MARRIVDRGFPLTLWARRRESYEPYARTAAAYADTPTALGAASDVMGICVVADADVEQVLTGPDGVLDGMAPGGIVAVHSTIHPDTCRRLAAVAAAKGISLIDAPVSGGGEAAAEGRLTVMVGGPEEAYAVARPVLETFGNLIVHLGPVGAGQVVKVINNLLMTAHAAIACQAYDLADGLGIDKAALAQVLGQGSGGSAAIGLVARSGYGVQRMAPVAGPLLRKDVDILCDLADRADAPVGVLVDLADIALGLMGRVRDQN
jgi:3-hydroxyisobutyrate dehydrogenase-like beta-hydroxyacid dehydrogenase